MRAIRPRIKPSLVRCCARLGRHGETEGGPLGASRGDRAIRREPRRFRAAGQAFACQSLLDSQHHLQRTARAFEELGAAEKQLAEAAAALGARLAEARARQEAQAELVQSRAREFEERTVSAADLITRYGAVGEMATDLNRHVLQLVDEVTNGGAPNDELVVKLGVVRARMAEVIEAGQVLVAAAGGAQFKDIAQQVDSLRQQMVSASTKVAALEENLRSR